MSDNHLRYNVAMKRFECRMPTEPVYILFLDGEEYRADLVKAGDRATFHCVQFMKGDYPKEADTWLPKKGSRKFVVLDGRIKAGRFVEEEREYSLV